MQSPADEPRIAGSADWHDAKAIVFVSFVCLAAVVLIVRRPLAGAKIQSGSASQTTPRAAVAARQPNDPFVLQLVQITPQTSDSKTLRFAVHGLRQLDALPGQFLTFSFLFDGQKESRCYSICSSPARSGYVEITPKRVTNGCVSEHAGRGCSMDMCR
jgi:hypothetical protein